MWELVEEDLEPIAIGAGILGTGGGGNPYLGFLRAREAVRRVGKVTVIDPTEVVDQHQIVVSGDLILFTSSIPVVLILSTVFSMVNPEL